MPRSIAPLSALLGCLLVPLIACDDGDEGSTTIEPRAVQGECVGLAGTGSTGSSFTWKGYFPDDLGEPWWSEREWQRRVHRDVAALSTEMLIGTVERTVDLDGACPSACKDIGFGWGGGACVTDVEISLGKPTTVGRTLTARQYSVEVTADAVAGCACAVE